MKKIIFSLALLSSLSVAFAQSFSCPADFTQKTPAITPATFSPQIVPAVNTWSNLADSPTVHAAHAMVALDTKIYVFG